MGDLRLTDEGVVRYEEQFPNQLKVLYEGISGYIYSCIDNGEFIKSHTNAVWTTEGNIAVHDVEYIADVYDEILKSEKQDDLLILRYEDSTSRRKQEIHEMMVRYIKKNNLLDSTVKKAIFIKDNFPLAWTEASSCFDI